jgi:hypothetical protein
VIGETAPFVVDDEQRAPPVLRRFEEGVDDVGDELLPHSYVARRMLVTGGALVLAVEGRVDKRQRGQLRPRAAPPAAAREHRPFRPRQHPYTED